MHPNPLLHVFPIGNNTIHSFLSARISDQEIKVYWGISKKLNPKNGRVKVVNYALSEPKLIIVQDPYNKLKDIARIVPLQDFKVIIPKLES